MSTDLEKKRKRGCSAPNKRRGLHQIVVLTLSGGRTTDVGLRCISILSNLTSLRIAGCSSIRDRGVAGSLCHLRALKLLDLSDCESVSSGGFYESTKHLQHQLHDLNLTRCFIVDMVADFSSVFACRALQRLDLTDSFITNAAIENITTMQQLRCLNLCRCGMITDVALVSVGVLVDLEELDLSDCDVTDVGLRSITTLQKLWRLDLTCCSAFTDAGARSIGELRQLRQLTMHCGLLTDDGISCIGTLRRLEHLELYYCGRVTDVGFSCICELSQLKHLKVIQCDHVTDAGIANGIHRLHELQELHLFECCQLGNGGLASISTLTELRVLHLYNNNTITDMGICHLASLKLLHRLHLSGCARVTDKGLATSLPLFKRVRLSHCDIVADGALGDVSPTIVVRAPHSVSTSSPSLSWIASMTQGARRLWAAAHSMLQQS